MAKNIIAGILYYCFIVMMMMTTTEWKNRLLNIHKIYVVLSVLYVLFSIRFRIFLFFGVALVFVSIYCWSGKAVARNTVNNNNSTNVSRGKKKRRESQIDRKKRRMVRHFSAERTSETRCWGKMKVRRKYSSMFEQRTTIKNVKCMFYVLCFAFRYAQWCIVIAGKIHTDTLTLNVVSIVVVVIVVVCPYNTLFLLLQLTSTHLLLSWCFMCAYKH